MALTNSRKVQMEESNKLKELELEKLDLESDIAFVKSAYKYDLQRLEYQLGGIDNKLLAWSTQSDHNIAREESHLPKD